MQTQHAYWILFGLIGLLVGFIVAEVAWHYAMRHANYVVPAAITKNANKIVWQKVFYYSVLCTLLAAERFLHVNIPEPVYWLDAFAIAGGDVQKLANKFFRLAK